MKPDAIAAIATAPGRAAIGVVRISGPDLKGMMPGLFGRALAPRRATFTPFLDLHGMAIDSGIGLYFPGPASYTGEDMLELQGHGGVGVLKSVLARCLAMGARLAEPGEFTRRAFLNGKLDLAQAEAVADLIEASSEAAARAAVRSLTGALSSAVNELNQSLLSLRIRLEAQIDFPEEEDTGAQQLSQFREQLSVAEFRAKTLLGRAIQGRQLRDGIRVALVGAPNVGKSSLLNYLAGDPVAIVTEVPGTTRDAIAVELSLEGVSVTLTDTAGLRRTQDPVEQIGVGRAREVAERSDLLVVVHDLTVESPEDDAILGLPQDVPQILAFNKADLIAGRKATHDGALYISAKTGLGVAELRCAIVERTGISGYSETSFSARQRHILALTEAVGHLERARSQPAADLMAEELRLSSYALAHITGQATPDDLLGHIFSTFCIGK